MALLAMHDFVTLSIHLENIDLLSYANLPNVDTFHHTVFLKITFIGTSLVAQWLRIRLPMQGTRVRALVREDPTYHRASKTVSHNY